MRRRGWPRDLGIAALLAGFVLLLYARLLFTNRVLASGDILFYFYPYRDFAAAALRSGELPFWNPYSFMGVPFLANPQAAVLYPLHWPLSWLPVTTQVYWSAALHTWLLGLGGYALLRVWGQGRGAALVTGLALAGSGFYGGLIGHLNQMNAAAWLPWAWAVLIWGTQTGEWRRAARAAALFALLTALMLLAGHTQTVYINLFGLGVWTLLPLGAWAARRLPRLRLPRGRVLPLAQTLAQTVTQTVTQTAWLWAIYGVGVGLAVLIAAPQLLPTLELSSRGLRQGGLSYAEASSFSLKPLHLLWTLLPSYGLADLSVVFATLGYTEFVAYVGSLGLLLAAWGAWRSRGPAWAGGLLLAALGLFLAAGRWNPVYYALYWAVPGFDLFRAPARWMMLYTLGMAVLAGLGWAQVMARWGARLPAYLVAAGIALLGLDLLLAARALPHTHTTAPQAVYDVRTAPAHLLSDPQRAALHPGAAGRFLSMSAITFDPGDMGDYAAILRDGPDAPLDGRAFEQLVIALKAQEILAPNLALLWRVPSLDGFDGGVLPLGRYLDLLTLFVPRDQLVPDGRLREQVTRIPPADLLALYNVQYVITDKVRDLWFEGIYYDRQIGATLGPDLPTVAVDAPLPFAATHLHLIAALEEGATAPAMDSAPVLTVTVAGRLDDGTPTIATLTVDSAQIATAAPDDPTPDGAVIAYRDVEGARRETLITLPLPAIQTPTALTLTWAGPPAPPLTVQAATLVDARTGMFTPLLPSDRGRFRRVHSGDVKIYENLDVLPRAYRVATLLPATDPADALAQVAARAFDPRRAAVVEGLLDAPPTPPADDPGSATLVSSSPMRVVITTTGAAPGLLVLADGDDPGWRATVDGQPAPILRTNVLARGVQVPAGTQTVEFVYTPVGWTRGLWLGLLGGLGVAALGIAAALGRGRVPPGAPGSARPGV